MKRILISSQGLARCPSCQTHIHLDTSISSQALELESCPFCEASLADAARKAPQKRGLRLGNVGKSALLAASLFGASMAIGCAGQPIDGGKEKVVADASPDAPPVQPHYGMPAVPDSGSSEKVVTDSSPTPPAPQPMYGKPGPP